MNQSIRKPRAWSGRKTKADYKQEQFNRKADLTVAIASVSLWAIVIIMGVNTI